MIDMQIPIATYRLQFTPQFRFADALRIIPYLQKLGISHIYASPVTRARSGSMHGYDVCDPSMVNPELGTLEEFNELLTVIAKKNMGWVQDIVPNHMAYSHENPYLVDVLENGSFSQYANFFDITWDHQYESLRGHVLAPFLGKPYGQCVVDGDLNVVFENGGLWAAYYDQRYPLSPQSYWTVLGEEADGLPSLQYDKSDEHKRFAELLHTMTNANGETKTEQRKMAKASLVKVLESNISLQDYIGNRVREFSTGTNSGNALFDRLMQQQNFRLAFWKVSAEELNYRRFFTVSDLICMRIEHEDVFEQTHKFILDFVEKGLINGLRIDHIDGLFDPATYLNRLRTRAPNTYIVVEKILDKTERLSQDWPVQGTTGYDFLNYMNYVFCDTKSEKRFDRLYERIAGRMYDPGELQLQKKRLIIGKHMAGDIDNIAHLVIGVAGTDLMGRDITLYGLRRALVEVLTNFPVYRTYITSGTFSNDDARHISRSLSLSRETLPGLTIEFAFIERFLMMRGDTVLQSEYDDAWKKAVMRFQQFTGPLMAKGFEDTLFYVYNRHIALNEVGGWPMHFGILENQFHAFISKRTQAHPHSMNASATHDTKRGEDTRARLQVLSEMPADWAKQVCAWRNLNTPYTTKSKGKIWPDSNDEYLLYQTLVGTFPLSGELDSTYVRRIQEYMIKAIREAKVHTAWIKPDEEYEKVVSGFVDSCLNSSQNPLFMDALRTFTRRVSWFGMLNSISQIVLKSTLPGVPDFYQGTELWDFSLVDPDNRRPVEYYERSQILEKTLDLENLKSKMEYGYIKEHLIQKCLTARALCREAFQHGTYNPLNVRGTCKNNLLAFSRKGTRQAAIVVVPRFMSHMVNVNEFPLGRQIWKDTRISFPRLLQNLTMKNIVTGSEIKLKNEILVGDVLESFPQAVLIAP